MNALASLSRRESEALTLLARFRFLTRSQLQSFLFADEHPELSARVMTKRILKSLVAKHLTDHTTRTIGGPTGGSGSFAYHLTSHGIRALDDRTYARLPRRLPPRGTFLMRHALAVADVALAFERSARSHDGHALLSFECDWEAAQRLGNTLVVPDATLVYATRTAELHALVEVDLGTAGATFFAKKIAAYVKLFRARAWRESFDLWPVVLVVTPNERRAEALRIATEGVIAAQSDRDTLRAQTEFAFASLASLATHGPLGAVWSYAGRTGRHGLLDRGLL